MISKDIETKIVLLFKNEKWPQTTIARELGIHRDAVRRVLQNNPETSCLPRMRLIDPYVPFLMEKLKEYPELTGSRLYQMVVERGFSGGADHFRTVLRELRPEKKYEAFTKITVLEGEQAQVDWASFGKLKVGNAERKLNAFIMVLSWSRQIFLKYFLNQEIGSFLQGHVDAFTFYQGIPREILHDNLKSAVIERFENLIKFNDNYLNFAAHYRFLPKACNSGRGNEKGRVERAVRYVRGNFFAGREFKNLQDLNEQALEWCQGISGERRCPSELLLSVKEAFEREKSKLLKLPGDSYPVYTRDVVKVGKTHYVKFDANEYSVPGDFVRKQLTVQATVEWVEFLFKSKVVAMHKRLWGKGECALIPAHQDEILKHKARLSYSRNIENLKVLLPNAEQFLSRIAMQGGSIGNAVQSLHSCLEDYGIELVQQGIEYVKNKEKVSITDLRITVEKLRAQKRKRIPIILSSENEEKINHLTISKPDLGKYDLLGK